MVQTANQPTIGQTTGTPRTRLTVRSIHLIALSGVVAAVALGAGITAMTRPQAEVATTPIPVTPRMIEEYEQLAGAVRIPVPPSVVSRYEEAAGQTGSTVVVPPSVVTRYQEEAGSASVPVVVSTAPSVFDDPFAFQAAWYRPAR